MSRRFLIVTHSGGFHADDVFAVAALLLLRERHRVFEAHQHSVSFGGAEVVRTRDEEIIAQGDYVVDVGAVANEARDRFDHHQEGGAGARDNGIPYAAFGLVWKKYGAEICQQTFDVGDSQYRMSEEMAQRVDARLVQAIDAWDNGLKLGRYEDAPAFPYFIQDAIFSFEPTWNEKNRSLDESFMQAVSFAREILAREITHARDALLGETQVRAAYEAAADKRIIVLDEKYEWDKVLQRKPEPLFVVTPERAPSTHWRVHTVRVSAHSFEPRLPFPKSWAGKRGEELAQASGVPDALFCHNKLFTVSAKTKGGALSLAQAALQK